MNSSNTDDFLPLHADAFRILASLRTEELHGYAIVKKLESEPGARRVLPANLYRRIRTLLQQELIREPEARPDPDVNSERRRYFTVTELGIAVLQAEAMRMKSLLASMGDVATP